MVLAGTGAFAGGFALGNYLEHGNLYKLQQDIIAEDEKLQLLVELVDKDNEELVVNRHAIKELTELESTSRALIHENQANEAIALGLSYATNLVMHVTEELKEILNILQISKNGHLALGAITYAGAKKILSNLGEKAEQKGYDLISKEP